MNTRTLTQIQEDDLSLSNETEKLGTDFTFKRKIVWFNAIGFLILHLLALVGVYLCFYAKFYTVIYMVLLIFLCGEGVTMGAHRLFSHKAYKANFLLRLILLVLHTSAGQNCMYVWVRDHRQHHKFSDTDADPHNATRGFFFSHIGWLMSKKHPLVIEKGKTIDMSDLESDKLVMFQRLFYKPLYIIFALAIPIAIPVYYWDETYLNSLFISFFARYIILLNITWLVNSWAHMFGTKPYDKNILPVESRFVSLVAIGEGWHNYHHTFPWDYRTSEFGHGFDWTTACIHACAKLGMAYDFKMAPESLISKRCKRTGDGTHPFLVDEQKKRSEIKMHECEQMELKNGKLTRANIEN